MLKPGLQKHRFLGVFSVFLVRRPNTKVKYNPKAHETPHTYPTKDKSPVIEGRRTPCENWKHEDEIDKSQKSQLNFEYNVYLLNYTTKI